MGNATKIKRRLCRVCGSLAGVSRTICDGCRMAEVRSHIKTRGRAGKPDPQTVQQAYGDSLGTLPIKDAQRKASTRSSVYRPPEDLGIVHETISMPHSPAGARVGFGSVLLRGADVLCNAQMFAATLVHRADGHTISEMLFNFSQRSLYKYVRGMIRMMDGRKRLPKSSKKKRFVSQQLIEKVNSPLNKAIGFALRMVRIFLQTEQKPLALKLGCSHAQVWHIESADNVIQPIWLEAYASVFKVTEESLWAFANAIAKNDELRHQPKELVRCFVATVLESSSSKVAFRKWRDRQQITRGTH